ncbi:MAG: hypothetical protein KDA91_07495 [Planctomycetaceae bacterium]|nr:hypothetical protein [Planctomycetaceae bacterium]
MSPYKTHRRSVFNHRPTSFKGGGFMEADGIADPFLDDAGPGSNVAGEKTPAFNVEIAEPDPEPEPTYRQWLRENVLRSRSLVVFTAFYVHWLIVIILAVLIIHSPETWSAVTLTATVSDLPEFEDSDPVLIETSIDHTMLEDASEAKKDESLASANALAMLPLEQSLNDLQISESLLRDLSERKPKASASRKSKASDKAENASHPVSTPSAAVVVGSFAVWTEPENPRPGQAYRIIIQVRLPKGTQEYDLSDLEGVVIGSDGYRKPVPGSHSGKLPISEDCVRFTVPVVAADVKVRDTVIVRSKMLKEMQQIVIEF